MAPVQGTSLTRVLALAASSFGTAEAEDDLSREESVRSCVAEARALGRVKAILAAEKSQLPPDAFLLKCLIYQHWDAQLAAGTAAGFLRFRRDAGWPLRISAREVEPALRSHLHWLLWPPKLSEAGTPAWAGSKVEGPAACIVFNLARLNPGVCSVEEYQKMSMFLMERATDNPATQRQGIALVVDFRGVQLSHLTRHLGMDDIRRGVFLWRGAFPCRMRRIWLVDPPAGIRLLTTSVLQLLSPKVRQRVCVATRASGGLAQLARDLEGVAELPKCLGGSGEVRWDEAVRSYLAEGAAGCASESAASGALRTEEGPSDARASSLRAWAFKICCVSRGYFDG